MLNQSLIAASSSPQKIRDLVAELSKENPNEKKVKLLMKDLNLPYTKDPVERLNTVFQALTPEMNTEH